jgi:hypothetical protein
MSGSGIQFSNGTTWIYLAITGINPATFFPYSVCGNSGNEFIVYPFFSIAFNWKSNSPMETGSEVSYQLMSTSGGVNLITTMTIALGSHSFPTSATLVDISGPDLLNTSSTSQSAAQDGASFDPGYTIATGSNGFAAILFSDPSSIQIGSNSFLSWIGGGSFRLGYSSATSCSYSGSQPIDTSFWYLTGYLLGSVLYPVQDCPDESLPAVAGVRGAQFSTQVNASGDLLVRDFEGVIQVADLKTGASVQLNSTQEVTLSMNGGNSQQALSAAVTTFDPTTVNQWWKDPMQMGNSSQTTTSTSSHSTTSTSASSSTPTPSTSPTTIASESSTTSASSFPSTVDTTGSQPSTTSPPNPVPEFPFQLVAFSAFIALLVASYIAFRKQRSKSDRREPPRVSLQPEPRYA